MDKVQAKLVLGVIMHFCNVIYVNKTRYCIVKIG